MDYNFDTAGRSFQITSYSNTAGTGTPLNQVQYDYNGYGQLITEYQAHSGSVSTSVTPKVQYRYNEGGDHSDAYNNNSRLTAMIYPNGRVLRYEYGSSSGLDYKISRLAFLADDAAGTIGAHIEEYQYLVERGKQNACTGARESPALVTTK
jgi:YD repeat-containing protein